MDEHESNIDKAKRAAQAAYEKTIAEDTRSFLNALPEQTTEKKPSRTLFLLSAVAASILILIIATFTINQSHNDRSIASAYGINQVTPRSAERVVNKSFTEAVRAYYDEDYQKASSILNALDSTDDQKLQDYKEWLSLLIDLQTAGSKSETFNLQLEAILDNEDHEFYVQAVDLKRDLNHFWRFLVF